MDNFGQVGWRRTRYPLHGISLDTKVPTQQPPALLSKPAAATAAVASAPPTIAPTAPERTAVSPPPQYAEVTKEDNESVPWYRAVTSGPVTPVLPTIEMALNSSLSSLHPADDVPTTDGSSTAVSVSHRSVSPSVNRGDTSSLDNTSNSRQEDAPVQNQWGRNRYPLQSPGGINAHHLSPPPSPQSEHEPSPPSPQEANESSVQPASPSEQSVGRKRTLRRTPGNRRIQLRALNPQESYRRSRDFNRSSSSIDSAQSDESVASPPTSPWRRTAYPFQSALPDSSKREELPQHHQPSPHQPAIQKSEVASSPQSASQPEKSQTAPAKASSWQRGSYPLQSAKNGSTNLPESPPSSPSSSEAGVEKVADIMPPEASEQEPAPTVKKLWRRRGYPLQNPASNTNLRQSPTPPPSPQKKSEQTSSAQNYEDSNQPSSQVEAKAEIAAIVGKSRHAYPLQSPASVPSLPKFEISSPDQPQEEQTTNPEQTSHLSAPREREIATKVVNHWRRHMYPVGSPKSVEPFQRAPTPQPPDYEDMDAAEEIHLPKNIRAVKDAENDSTKSGKTIVVCLDGTGDKFDDDNSNIVHLISALKKDDPNQVSYYQAGIGTYSAGGLTWGFAAAADMAVGSGLGLHVRDAYHFLMHSYKEGDKICIFGFSRGAYTARCLGGMIHKVGLLPPRNIQQIDFAYEFYKKDTPEGWKQSEDFKKTFSIDVSVYFLGCFDSVASVGFIPRQLPLSTTPFNKPRFFRHAMALDERRAKFKVCRHETKGLKEIDGQAHSAGSTVLNTAESFARNWLWNYKSQDDQPPGYSEHNKFGKHHHPNVTDEEYTRLTGHEAPFDTDVLEVWFAGAHADVGGGAVPNIQRHKLAQIPLRWMIRQCFECNTGIIFKTKMLAEFGLDVHTLWPKYKRLTVPTHAPSPSYLEKFDEALPSRQVRRNKLKPIEKFEGGEHFYQLSSHRDEDWTPEQVEDFYDAMSPLNDQLLQAPSWWILEAWPVQYKVPKGQGEVIIRTGMNLGRYRGVEDVEPNVHWTVLHRAEHLGYKINVRTAAHTSWRAVV